MKLVRLTLAAALTYAGLLLYSVARSLYVLHGPIEAIPPALMMLIALGAASVLIVGRR